MKILTPIKPITKFKGVPAFRATALPSIKAQVQKGWKKPDVWETLFFAMPKDYRRNE